MALTAVHAVDRRERSSTIRKRIGFNQSFTGGAADDLELFAAAANTKYRVIEWQVSCNVTCTAYLLEGTNELCVIRLLANQGEHIPTSEDGHGDTAVNTALSLQCSAGAATVLVGWVIVDVITTS